MAQAGKDFPDFFAADRYAARHVEGLNAHDPESLITGAEIARGLTYYDKRDFHSKRHYSDVIAGEDTIAEIEAFAPRRDWRTGFGAGLI